MSKWVDKDGIWWHETASGEKRKLLINPETKQPYKCNEIILEGKHKGKRFKAFRYDRFWVSNPDYWPYKYFSQAKNLDTYDKSYRIPTPAVISFSGGRTSGSRSRSCALRQRCRADGAPSAAVCGIDPFGSDDADHGRLCMPGCLARAAILDSCGGRDSTW